MNDLVKPGKKRFVLYRKGSDTGELLAVLALCGVTVWANWDTVTPHWYWLVCVAIGLIGGKIANEIYARWPQKGAAASRSGGASEGIAIAPPSPKAIPASRNKRLVR